MWRFLRACYATEQKGANSCRVDILGAPLGDDNSPNLKEGVKRIEGLVFTPLIECKHETLINFLETI